MQHASEHTTTSSTAGFERHPGFAAWPAEARRELDRIGIVHEYANGTELYRAGDPVTGLYLVRRGRVELLLKGTRGRFIVSHIVEPGGTIGLGPTVGGKPYEFTARTIGPTVLSFVPRVQFLAILARYPEATVSVSEVLSSEVELAYRRLIALRA
jgi:CRP-like cAMP-binding protein